MQLNIRLIRYDLLENTESVIAEGRAVLSGNTLSYREKEHPENLHRVTFADNGVTLKRSAEYASETRLLPEGRGEAIVHSPYGDMRLATVLENWSRSEEKWMVEYRVISQGDVVTRQRLVWEMRGTGNERD